MKPTPPLSAKAVVFDVYGTLAHIGLRRSPFRQLLQWLRQQGRQPLPDDAERLMSNPLGLAGTAALFGANPPLALLAEWEAELQHELMSIQLFADSLPVLAALRQAGLRLGLCSNLAAPYAVPIQALLPGLDCYAWSFEVGAVKPDPRLYGYLCQQLDCQPAEILFVGDTRLADYDGPKAFGMQARQLVRAGGALTSGQIASLTALPPLLLR